MGVDIHFGAHESELARVADLQWWQGGGLLQSMWPKSMGRKIACSFWDIMKMMKGFKRIPGRGEQRKQRCKNFDGVELGDHTSCYTISILSDNQGNRNRMQQSPNGTADFHLVYEFQENHLQP